MREKRGGSMTREPNGDVPEFAGPAVEESSLERENRELRSRVTELEKLVTIDPLTKVGNRRGLEEAIEKIRLEKFGQENFETERRRENEGSTAILCLDADGF